MAFRVLISALVLVFHSLAIRDVGEVHDEESVSTLQVAATNFSDTACMKFYTHDCGLHPTEAPSEIKDMREAFVKCCTESGKYEHNVCQPFMEQIFEGHQEPSAQLCSKLSTARDEHHRFVQLLQNKAHVDTQRTAVTEVELDMTISQKLGFDSPQKNFACAEDWGKRLHRARHAKNVHQCMHRCEFAPECEAISFMDQTCVLCGTPTMAYREGWTTYVKRGTTRESRARCHENRDCDYPTCNTGGWDFECLMPGHKNGRCVNRRHSSLCAHRDNDEMPVPGHWCLNHHLYRVCPRRSSAFSDDNN